jgi:hypothetical protein
VGLIGVTASKFLVMNGLDQLTSLSQCLLALYKRCRRLSIMLGARRRKLGIAQQGVF